MKILAEHRSISVITLLHTGFVIYGILGTKVFINFREKIEMPIPAFPERYTTFGLLLLLLPIVWLVFLEILDRKDVDWEEGIVAICITVGIVGSAFVAAIVSMKAVEAASVF